MPDRKNSQGLNKWQKYYKLTDSAPNPPRLSDLGQFVTYVDDTARLLPEGEGGDIYVVGLRSWAFVFERRVLSLEIEMHNFLGLYVDGEMVSSGGTVQGNSTRAVSVALNPGWNRLDILVSNLTGPGFLRVSPAIASLVDVLDAAIEKPLSPPLPSSLREPGFEKAPMDASWLPVQYGSGSSTLALDNAVFRTGVRSARVTSTIRDSAFWAQLIRTKKNTYYRISGWIKTKDVGSQARGAAIRAVDGRDWPQVKGSTDWTRVENVFFSGSRDVLVLTAGLGEYFDRNVGTAWFDDIALEEIPTTIATSKYLLLALPTEIAGTFKDASAWLSRLDKVYEVYADMMGFRPYDGSGIKLRIDYNLPYGAIAGKTIIVNADLKQVADEVNKGGYQFGVVHEIGHDFDEVREGVSYGGWVWEAEFWATFKLTYAMETLKGKVFMSNEWYDYADPNGKRLDNLYRKVGEEKGTPAAAPFSGDNWWINNDASLDRFLLLKKQIGWQPFIASLHELSSSGKIPGSREDRLNLFVGTLAKHTSFDVKGFLKGWGYPVV